MIVRLDFDLAEDVTPRLFAARVAQACVLNGAIRPGESITSEAYTEHYTRHTYEDVSRDLEDFASTLRTLGKDDPA